LGTNLIDATTDDLSYVGRGNPGPSKHAIYNLTQHISRVSPG
jgi:hypothetical protein